MRTFLILYSLLEAHVLTKKPGLHLQCPEQQQQILMQTKILALQLYSIFHNLS